MVCMMVCMMMMMMIISLSHMCVYTLSSIHKHPCHTCCCTHQPPTPPPLCS